MAEEPRRSGRATKGQHTKTASSSPAPQPKPAKQSTKPKAVKKSKRTQADAAAAEEYDEEDDEKIRCICGDDNPRDKRAFIECEACQVWQHNVCMGMPDDDDDLPDHYFCEECSPEEHGETLAALARGEKIWETRNRIYQNEKKASGKRKSKGGPPGWLKKEVQYVAQPDAAAEEEEVPGTKRKRGNDPDPVSEPEIKEESEERSARGSRQDKRRKAATNGGTAEADTETALLDIDRLPADRQKVATALSKIISEDVQSRAQSGEFRIPEGQTVKSIAEHHAVRIEYALKMNHEGPQNPPYLAQFRTLNANLKKNKVLITRLLDNNLTADELSTMESKDLASEELQKQNALLKEQADRQAVAIQDEGPRYRRTHKGDELIEDENAMLAEGTKTIAAQPVRERTSVAEEGQQDAGDSPSESARRSTSRPQTGAEQRRTSSQQFDVDEIWAKTAQSPTSANAPRPMQMPARRRSSIKPDAQPTGAGGTKEDADIDRLLQDDDDETYSPAEYADGTSTGAVVWRGKLIQSADGVTSTVNARFVAGRDLTDTVSWNDLLPTQLTIDGRLQIDSAELYLRSLQYSHTTDVSVLMMTPYDDVEAFDAVFQYFKSRGRYAVVNKDRPDMVRDLYLMPVDQGEKIPSHVDLLMFNQLGDVLKEKCLLATFVVSRNLEVPPAIPNTSTSDSNTAVSGVNGQQTTLPQHMRVATGPAGSPLNANPATFSPPIGGDPMAGYPPNAYGGAYPAPSPNPLVNEILGGLQFAPTAQAVLTSDPNISREMMMHLRQVLENDPSARTDINALANKLNVP